jgi:addiction module HigA family antidote
MDPLRLDAVSLAAALGVEKGRITRLLADKQPVTSDMALRLARCFRTTPQFWLGLQTAYDLCLAEAEHGAEIAAQVQPIAA